MNAEVYEQVGESRRNGDEMVELELAVQSVGGVRVAGDVGARRVELCSALAVGGLTPSAGLIEAAVAAAGSQVRIQVLIRPRPGGFRYDADELGVCLADVRRAVALGAAGVVVGCVDDDGRLDLDAIARMRDSAQGADVTVHRAVDVTPDPVAAVASLRPLGVRRVLTSGGRVRAYEALDVLRRMVDATDGRVEVMAGSGLDAATIPEVVATGVNAIHLSARRTEVSDAGGPVVVGPHDITDRDLAASAARALAVAVGAAR